MWIEERDVLRCDNCRKGIYIVEFDIDKEDMYYPWYCPYCGKRHEEITQHEK